MDINFLETTLNYNWDMIPVDRSFDRDKIRAYVSQMNEIDRNFVIELLKKTRYVPYYEFKEKLLESFRSFQRAIGGQPFYILRSRNKIGSEDWLMALLWPQLRRMNLIDIIDGNTILRPRGRVNILIIDDAIYSGLHTYGTIESLILSGAGIPEDEYDLTFTDEGMEKIWEVSSHYVFHIVIPFATRRGLRVIRGPFGMGYGGRLIFHGVEYLPGIGELINIREYYPEWTENEAYQENKDNILRRKFGKNLNNIISDMPLVYFDHKVAASISTFRSIYLEGRLPDGRMVGSLFKVDPSREKIEQLSRLYDMWVANSNKV